jgi:hypothetical protein
MVDLIDALIPLIEQEFNNRKYQDTTGTYVAPESYNSGLPPRKQDGGKQPTILYQILSGEDEDDEVTETIGIDIIPCVYVPRRDSGDEITQQEEGNRDISNMITLIKSALRKNRIVGGRYRRTGKISWAILEDSPQPSPFFKAVIRAEYETMIMTEPNESEVKAYGSDIK